MTSAADELVLTCWRYAASGEAFFKIELNAFMDTLIIKLFFPIVDLKSSRGDVTNVSALKTSLAARVVLFQTQIT